MYFSPAPPIKSPIKEISNKHIVGEWDLYWNSSNSSYKAVFLVSGEYKCYNSDKIIYSGNYLVYKNNTIFVSENGFLYVWKLKIITWHPQEKTLTGTATIVNEITIKPKLEYQVDKIILERK